MKYLKKGLMVDFIDNPKVFLVKGYGELRIQKGNTRVNGITLEQLKFIVKTLEGEEDGQKPDTPDDRKNTTGKARANDGRSPKSRKSNKSSSK